MRMRKVTGCRFMRAQGYYVFKKRGVREWASGSSLLHFGSVEVGVFSGFEGFCKHDEFLVRLLDLNGDLFHLW